MCLQPRRNIGCDGNRPTTDERCSGGDVCMMAMEYVRHGTRGLNSSSTDTAQKRLIEYTSYVTIHSWLGLVCLPFNQNGVDYVDGRYSRSRVAAPPPDDWIAFSYSMYTARTRRRGPVCLFDEQPCGFFLLGNRVEDRKNFLAFS